MRGMPGYWGPHIGFYGGINYGFGYTGVGFVGGEWRGGAFYYNRSVTNVSVTNVTNVYNRTVVVNNTRTVSYNGGQGGIEARPTPQEEAAARERHTAPLATQTEHEHMASQNRQNFASENHGRPAIAATARPGDFSGRSAVPARAAGGEYHAPAMSPKEARVGSPQGNKANSEGGFRPFTKPNSSNSSSNNNSQNRGSAGSQNRGTGNSTNQGYVNSGSKPRYEPQDKANRPAASNPPRGNTSRPAPPRQSSPPPQQHRSSPPPPQRQSPPKQEHHQGR